jgi:hypothetical protein
MRTQKARMVRNRKSGSKMNGYYISKKLFSKLKTHCSVCGSKKKDCSYSCKNKRLKLVRKSLNRT